MIDWTLICAIVVVAMVLNEVAITRAKFLDTMVCFQPLWSHRLLLACLIAGVALNVETAKFAFENPNVHRIWYLLFTAAPPMIAIYVYGFTEIAQANIKLNALAPKRTNVFSFLPKWTSGLIGGLGGLVSTVTLVIIPKYALDHPRPQTILWVEVGIAGMIVLSALVFLLEVRQARCELAEARLQAGK